MAPIGGNRRARDKASGGPPKRCFKGKSCGGTCISRLDRCLLDTPDSVSNAIVKLRERLKKGPKGGTKGSRSSPEAYKARYEKVAGKLLSKMDQYATSGNFGSYLRLEKLYSAKANTYASKFGGEKIDQGKLNSNALTAFNTNKDNIVRELNKHARKNERGKYNSLEKDLLKIEASAAERLNLPEKERTKKGVIWGNNSDRRESHVESRVIQKITDLTSALERAVKEGDRKRYRKVESALIKLQKFAKEKYDPLETVNERGKAWKIGRYKKVTAKLKGMMLEAAVNRDRKKYERLEKKLLSLQASLGDKLEINPAHRKSKGEVWKEGNDERLRYKAEELTSKLLDRIRKAAIEGDRNKYDRMVDRLEKLSGKLGKSADLYGMGSDRDKYWDKVRKDASESKPSGRRGRGQSLDGKAIDIEKLRSRIYDWRRANGLYTTNIGTSLDRHDASHVLIKDYLGKSSEQIAKLIGLSGKGPSVLEEILADTMDNYPSSGRPSKSWLTNMIYQSIKITAGTDLRESGSSLESLGALRTNPDRAVSTIVKYFTAMSNRPDFDKFIETLQHARKYVASDTRRVG